MFGMRLEIEGHNTLGPELAKAAEQYNGFAASVAQNSAKVSSASRAQGSAIEQLRSRTTNAMTAVRSAVTNATTAFKARIESWGGITEKSGAKIEAAADRIRKASASMQQHAVDAFNKVRLAAVAAAAAAVIVAQGYEQAMARVSATTRATGAQMRVLDVEARRLGSSMIFGSKDVAQAMAILGENTGDAATVLAAIGPVAEFAAGQAMDLGEAAGFVAQQMDAFGLSGAEASRITNAFSAAIGKIDPKALLEGLTSLGPIAGTLNVSLEQTIALLATLDQTGQGAGRSAAGLQGIFLSLQNPSAELKALLGGVSVQTDGVFAAMKRLAEQSPAALAQVFDRKQLGIILAIASQGAGAFDSLTQSITGTTAASEAYARQTATTQAQLRILKNAIGEALIEAFQTLSGTSVQTLEQVTAKIQEYKAVFIGFIASVRDFVSEHREALVAAAKFAVVMGTVAVVLGLVVRTVANVASFIKGAIVVFQAIPPIVGVIRVAFAAAAEGVFAFVTSIAAIVGWPVLIAAAAAALIAFAVHAYKTNETVRAVFDSIIDGAKAFGKYLFEHLTAPFRLFFEFVGKAMSFVGELFPGLAQKVQAAVGWMKDKASSSWEAISGGAEKAFAWVGDKADAAKDVVVQGAGKVREAWDNSLLNVGARADEVFSNLGEKGKRALGAMQPRLSDFARMATEASKRSAGSTSGGTGGGGGGSAASSTGGGSPAMFAELGILLAAQSAAILKTEDEFKASQLRIVGSAPKYTAEYLAARQSLIKQAYEEDVREADGSAARVAEATLRRDEAMRDAMIENHEAIWQHWIQANYGAALTFQALGSAYDSVVDLMIQKEGNFGRYRKAAWESFKRTFVGGAAQMFKAYIAEQIKAQIIGDAIKEKSAAKSKFQDAKSGAVAAFHAFAAIPIVGPALGAAAAAAAFAFLIAFNRGGLVPGSGPNRDSVPAILTPSEFVIRREAVEKVGPRALSYINQTGRLPETGGALQLNLNVNGGSTSFAESVRDFFDDEIVPRFEQAMKDGRIRGTMKPARI